MMHKIKKFLKALLKLDNSPTTNNTSVDNNDSYNTTGHTTTDNTSIENTNSYNTTTNIYNNNYYYYNSDK